MAASTFKFTLNVPRQVQLPEVDLMVDRNQFFDWIWARFGPQGLLGVHEGTLLSEAAAEQGLETDSWTVDSGQAPAERDWIGGQEEAQVELYFSGPTEACQAVRVLDQMGCFNVGLVEEQKSEDWDAQWKASFLNSGSGVPIPPFWRIVPPWFEKKTQTDSDEKILRINPGAGFGTGTHETTQLCLEVLGEASKSNPFHGERVLDFGSGSGILSIGLALLGGQVDSVEIDPLALDNALENARLNGVEDQISFSASLTDAGSYRVIVANILKPVLLEFADALVHRLQPDGILVLSGLIEKDVPAVIERYSSLLKCPVDQVLDQGEWRALRLTRKKL